MIKLCAFADEYGNSLEEQIEGLKSNGIKYIEIRNVNGKNIVDLTIEEAKEIYQAFLQNGIQVWSVGSPLGKVDIDCDFEKYQEKVHHVCKLANIFQTKNIRVFSFFNAYDKKELVFSYLQQMVEIANSYNVYLCHENEKDVYGDTVERVLEIMNEVKGLKFVYDPANYIQCHQDCKAAMEMLFDRTYYFHIKDVIAATGELVPAGYGDGYIAQLIERIDRDIVLTVEPHLAIFKGYDAIDNTQMNLKFSFNSNAEAFNCASQSLKKMIIDAGYYYSNDGYVRD